MEPDKGANVTKIDSGNQILNQKKKPMEHLMKVIIIHIKIMHFLNMLMQLIQFLIYPISKYHNEIYPFSKYLNKVYPFPKIFQNLIDLKRSNKTFKTIILKS